ncbi:MAG: hypothetical protein Kow002_13430 [Anaerolineales bacterium]
MKNTTSVPNSLRTWFVIHFTADMLFGIPLLFFPRVLLPLLGWTTYDPMTSRLVGAALMGIGIESLLARNASAATYRAMLNLKVIWASSALFAIGAALLEGAPPMGWVFLGIFFVFWCVWVYYRLKLK